jgi:arsenate reductase (thioredoxin)
MRDGPAEDAPGRTVVFVCPHGAGKSRIAAAWFNRVAPPCWRATSAGVTPQATVSAHAARLLAGSPAAALLDGEVPRPLAAVADPDLVVAIDCGPGEVPGALAWTLTSQRFDAALAAELRQRAETLARALAGGAGSTNAAEPTHGPVAR